MGYRVFEREAIPSWIFFGGIFGLVVFLICSAPGRAREFRTQKLEQIRQLEQSHEASITLVIEDVIMDGVVVPEGVRAVQNPRWGMDWTFEGPPDRVAELLRRLYGLELEGR